MPRKRCGSAGFHLSRHAGRLASRQTSKSRARTGGTSGRFPGSRHAAAQPSDPCTGADPGSRRSRCYSHPESGPPGIETSAAATHLADGRSIGPPPRRGKRRLGPQPGACWDRRVGRRRRRRGDRSADSFTPGPPSLGGGFVSDGIKNARGGREAELSLATPLWLPGEGTASRRVADADLSRLTAQQLAQRLAVAGEVRESLGGGGPGAGGGSRSGVSSARCQEPGGGCRTPGPRTRRRGSRAADGAPRPDGCRDRAGRAPEQIWTARSWRSARSRVPRLIPASLNEPNPPLSCCRIASARGRSRRNRRSRRRQPTARGDPDTGQPGDRDPGPQLPGDRIDPVRQPDRHTVPPAVLDGRTEHAPSDGRAGGTYRGDGDGRECPAPGGTSDRSKHAWNSTRRGRLR